MKLFSAIGEWFAAHRKLGIVTIVALVAALGAGSYFGLRHYQWHRSSGHALEELQKALNPPDPVTLAHLVDFHSLGRDMARGARAAFPFLHEGDDPERSISHTVQKALLKKFMAKQSKGSQFPEDQSEMAQLSKPLDLLPPDFTTQLLQKATVRDEGEDRAIVTVQLENPQLKKSFPLELELTRTDDGWRVRHLLNARELAQELREAVLARYAGLRNAYLAKNAETTRKMNTAMPIQLCTADAGVLSDGRTFVMVVHAVAKNNGPTQVNNFNLDTSIYGKNGQVVWRHFLNAAEAVPPGDTFDRRWNVELDATSPEAQALLRERPLQCRPHWQTLSLGNGQVWHIDEVPNPAQLCNKPGHQHPSGFCMLPIFQR